MSDSELASSDKKVQAIFRELAGERAEQLNPAVFPAAVVSAISAALTEKGTEMVDASRADEIAFHLVDWNSDAAFLVAMLLFPERFTPEEIREGVFRFIIHAPDHVIAAARLSGHPAEDIFDEGYGERS